LNALILLSEIEVWHGLVIIMFSTACYMIYWKWSDEVIIFLHLIQFCVSHFLESICAHIFISSVTPNCFLRTLTSQQQIICSCIRRVLSNKFWRANFYKCVNNKYKQTNSNFKSSWKTGENTRFWRGLSPFVLLIEPTWPCLQ
jgi:hypothetical protein